MFFRNDAGELVFGRPTWEQQMRALGEAIGRWRRNNPRPERGEATAEAERLALTADVRRQMLDDLYPMGGVLREQEWLRLTHQDLAEMSDVRLGDERDRLRLRLYLDRPAEPWLRERLRRIEEERRARSGVMSGRV
jgi:hypothetical protein